jgi:tetratricopeptide (TPR) repeat protein
MKAPWPAALVLALGACSSPPSAPPPPDQRDGHVPQEGREAANAEWAKVLEEALKGQGVAEQQRVQQSLRHYELALAWFNKGDFEKAKADAQKAVQVWPENLAARKLLSDVGEILVGGPTGLRTSGDVVRTTTLVRVEQAQLEITLHLVHGRRFMEARLYDSALKEFENAEFKILNMPWEVKAMNDLLPQVRAALARAKDAGAAK